MATQSQNSPQTDSQTTPPNDGVPDWKIGILEKKRRAKEAELLLIQEKNLKQEHIPGWKRELIKRTRGSQVPVFKPAPPLPPSPPPVTDPSLPLQEHPPLPLWIREKLSKVANQPRPEQTDTMDTYSPTPPSLPHVVQNIVYKFSSSTPPLPHFFPPAVTSHNSHQLPEDSHELNLMDDSSLAGLPDWKRSIIVRRKRGQVLKRLSLTKDDFDLISSLRQTATKSTPDEVDIQLQNMSDKRDLEEREAKLQLARQEEEEVGNVSSQTDTSNLPIVAAGKGRSFFVTQEPQMKVRELLDKFAPIPSTPLSVILSPSFPKSMRISKRPPPPPPTAPPPLPPPRDPPAQQRVTSSPAHKKADVPTKLPLSPELILTVEEYNKHHALLVQTIADQMTPSMSNGIEGMLNFIIPESSPVKRPRILSPETPISSVDPYKQITEISQPLFIPPPSKYEQSALDIPDISPNVEKPIDTSLEEVTLSYIDEISDDVIVPIHRPLSPDQIPPVPWRDTLEKIKSKRQEKIISEIYENIIIVSSHEAPTLKSVLKSPGARSQRGRIHFSDKNPSIYQYPKVEIEDTFNPFLANQEELSHRLHPSIFSSRQVQPSNKLQNYTPAILDYFDSLVTASAQPRWMHGEGDEEQSPSRDDSDEMVASFTAVPMDFEEELDMSNLSDRAAAMIW